MQVVLSRRVEASYSGDPFELYRRVRHTTPAPYLFHLKLGDRALIGGSPEVLLKVSGRKVTVRPIAGTRRRGKTPAEDAAIEAELKADPKERAEHVMLLDLGRNDVGRVSRPGSVAIEEREVIERYSHVMHLVSQVSGELRDGLDAFDAIASIFPAGHGERRAEGPGHGDHRRARAGRPRPLRRGGRVRRLRRRGGPGDHHPRRSRSPAARCASRQARASSSTAGRSASSRRPRRRCGGCSPRSGWRTRSDDPGDRQLRLVHLEPRPVPLAARGRARGRAQRRDRRRGHSSRRRRTRSSSLPARALRIRRASPSRRSARSPARCRSSASVSGTRRLARPSARRSSARSG